MRSKPNLPQWREWLPTLDDEVRICDPATAAVVAAAESNLKLRFDEELRSLLLASDGVMGPCGYWLVWPTQKIVAENVTYRTTEDFKELYMPFDNLLFVGEVGNGDLFAFPINGDGNVRDEIFRWDHETDGRFWVASTLRQYLQDFTDGTIEA